MNKRISLRDMILCALFAALITAGAFIKVPIPLVPFTMQFFFTMMAGLFLGGRLGAISVLVYIVLGLMGLPVFAEGGGLSYILKPSFGYLIGFCVGSYVTGIIANKVQEPSYKRLLSANFSGLIIVYICGLVYFYIISNYVINSPITLWPLILYCFILAVPGDIVLCLLGATFAKRTLPILKKA